MGGCHSLGVNDQLVLTDCNGNRSTVEGPGFTCSGPCTSANQREALVLASGVRAVLIDDETAHKRCIYGPQREFMKAGESPETVDRCPDLSPSEYIVVTDQTNGERKNIIGPQLYQLGPYETASSVRKVFNLSRYEYIRVKDQNGRIRVEIGEKRVVPEASETVIDTGVKQAINIDEHNAVLVRNLDTGKLELLTEHGLFFPGPFQDVIEVRKKIVLEEYQTVVYQDAEGRFNYVRGDGELRNFFLPPFCQLVTQEWSTDLRKEHSETEEVWKFDRRPSYMNYEFNCRTVDNVELQIDVSFFWAIIDVQLLIQKTADAPGDTCTHARSRIIQEVSRIKLLDFLESFNDIIRGACVGDTFYEERGVNLISVEVLRFKCASRETDRILQEIIQETADRLKKKEHQKGENEVALSRLSGEIEEEQMKKELIELKKSHLKTEARIEGEAEAHKLRYFLHGVTSKQEDGGEPLSMDKAMQVYMSLRKLDSVKALSDGASQIYLTPSDVNLSIGQMFPTTAAAGAQAINPY